MGRRVPHSKYRGTQPTRVPIGSVVSSPSEGPRQSPAGKRVLVHLDLELERTHLIMATNLLFLTFWQHIFSHI